ncbi:10011_t:CDS:2 [Racocetra fulgida]|uniref:Glutamate--cysteine ligase n=1 Tax=Racocetra fulgida TaxID=60492 RepID=A0A9N8VHV9_9GLOM|nr:10008_t:CDS:2 [Racocetra fulgida]CAG8448874.1 10011_t:CDS:2 [Racocetra fulgida]
MGLLSSPGTPLQWEETKQYAHKIRALGISYFVSVYKKLKEKENSCTPGTPYGGTLKSLLQIEPNMKLRREIISKFLRPNEVAITLTSFPRLGASGQFLEPHYEPAGNAARSLFVPDEVAINVPIFRDKCTPDPFIDTTIPLNRNLFPEDKEAAEGAAQSDHIYMDAMVFGMGCCCLQITFQACNAEEARRLYDQLAVMESPSIPGEETSSDNSRLNGHANANESISSVEDEYEQMTINEIINGNGDKFPGLNVLICRYLESVNIDIETRCQLGIYQEFVSRRAKGKL